MGVAWEELTSRKYSGLTEQRITYASKIRKQVSKFSVVISGGDVTCDSMSTCMYMHVYAPIRPAMEALDSSEGA